MAPIFFKLVAAAIIFCPAETGFVFGGFGLKNPALPVLAVPIEIDDVTHPLDCVRVPADSETFEFSIR